MKDGEIIRLYVVISGNLFIERVEKQDSGTYTCMADDGERQHITSIGMVEVLGMYIMYKVHL